MARGQAARPRATARVRPCERATPFDVQVDDVSFAYEDEAVLDGVSVSFPERSLTALVGFSGSIRDKLDHGRVAEAGTHDTLLARGALYAGMWREQERAKSWRLVGSDA